jgi:hypothetical protein
VKEMDYALLFGGIVGAWIVTRIVYILINFRLNNKQETAVGFVAGIIITLLTGKYELVVGFFIWFLLDITGVTNNPKKTKDKDIST